VISSEKCAFHGTVAYATEIFFEALEKKAYTSYLGPDSYLPMVYIDDCIDATVKLIKADNSKLSRRVY
jgi:nucleoside-diphosphate-sugar epimerase